MSSHGASTTNELARNAIGLREVLFQSVATMGPAAGIALLALVGANYAGGALPLSALLALAGCVLVAVSIGQLAQHLPSAGGFYTYASRGIHRNVGFLVAWTYAFILTIGVPLLLLLFGTFVANVLNAEFSANFDTWWIVLSMSLAVLVFLLGYRGVGLSTRTGVIIGVIEIAIFVVLSIWLIIDAGSRNTIGVFSTRYANVPGFGGFGGVVAGSVFVILAFVGFEACVPLAEEARDPRRTVKRAVVYAALAVGAVYLLTTYAATVWFGPRKFAAFPAAAGGNPWVDLIGRSVWGGGWVIIFLVIANSTIGSANALANAATRTIWAMGRIRFLPPLLARTRHDAKSPYVAQLLQLVTSVVITLGLGLAYDPVTAAGILGAAFTIGAILLYMVVNLSCVLFYLREQRGEFNIILHVVVPLAGIAAFVPAFFSAAGITVFKFVTKLPYPINLAGPIDAVWLALGILVLVYFVARHPDRVRATGRIFLEDDVEPELGVGPASEGYVAKPIPSA